MKPALLLLWSALLFSTTVTGASLRTIAESGRPAAGFPDGFIYWNLDDPVIGGGGHVAFPGVADMSMNSTQQNTAALWHGMPGRLTTAIKAGESPEGFPANIVFSAAVPGKIVVSDQGSVAFLAAMSGANNRGALLVTMDGVTHGIVQEGAPAPGFPPGTVIGNLLGYAFTDAGLAFFGTTSSFSSQAGLWFWNRDTVELVLANGDDFAQLYPGCEVISLWLQDLSQQGTLLVDVSLYGERGLSCPIGGLYTWREGEGWRKMVAVGDPAPGMPESVHFSRLRAQPLGSHINDVGDVFFQAEVYDADSGRRLNMAWVARADGQLLPIALTGEGAPGRPSELIQLNQGSVPVGNSKGTVAITAYSSAMSQMILAGASAAGASYPDPLNPGESRLGVLAHGGDQPPGFGATWYLEEISNIAINNQGRVLFSATVRDALQPPYGERISGLWIGDSAANLELAVAQGRPVNIDGQPDELTGITTARRLLRTAQSTNSGLPIQFNDRGQFVFSGTRQSAGYLNSLFIGMANTPECSGLSVVIPVTTYPDGAVIYCLGEESLEAPVSVRVAKGADVTWESPLLSFGPGFSVEQGGLFRAVTL